MSEYKCILHLHYFPGFLPRAPGLDQLPETCVVKIVDVTVRLAPAQVVTEGLCTRIQHGPRIKGWGVQELCVREEIRPEVDVAGGKARDQCCHQFAAGKKNNNSCSTYLGYKCDTLFLATLQEGTEPT